MLPAPHAIEDRPPAADRVPTLTEVVDMGPAEVVEEPVVLPPTDTSLAAPPPDLRPAGPDPEWLVAQVLQELAPRIEMLLEARLREALAPALARAADGLIRDTRGTLSGALRELVEESVARAITRHGGN